MQTHIAKFAVGPSSRALSSNGFFETKLRSIGVLNPLQPCCLQLPMSHTTLRIRLNHRSWMHESRWCCILSACSCPKSSLLTRFCATSLHVIFPVAQQRIRSFSVTSLRLCTPRFCLLAQVDSDRCVAALVCGMLHSTRARGTPIAHPRAISETFDCLRSID